MDRCQRARGTVALIKDIRNSNGIVDGPNVIVAFEQQVIPMFDYGNNIRQMAKDEGCANAVDFPGLIPAYFRPLFCRAIGPYRWDALRGDPEDIFKTDAKVTERIPDDRTLHNWLDLARECISLQGLPARNCWVDLGQRHKRALVFNEMACNGELKAPIVIGLEYLDRGSVASPNRETESMMDGSDAVRDWPLLNVMLWTVAQPGSACIMATR